MLENKKIFPSLYLPGVVENLSLISFGGTTSTSLGFNYSRSWPVSLEYRKRAPYCWVHFGHELWEVGSLGIGNISKVRRCFQACVCCPSHTRGRSRAGCVCAQALWMNTASGWPQPRPLHPQGIFTASLLLKWIQFYFLQTLASPFPFKWFATLLSWA